MIGLRSAKTRSTMLSLTRERSRVSRPTLCEAASTRSPSLIAIKKPFSAPVIATTDASSFWKIFSRLDSAARSRLNSASFRTLSTSESGAPAAATACFGSPSISVSRKRPMTTSSPTRRSDERARTPFTMNVVARSTTESVKWLPFRRRFACVGASEGSSRWMSFPSARPMLTRGLRSGRSRVSSRTGS